MNRQFFIRYQLIHGNSLPVEAAGISSSGIRISNCQNTVAGERLLI